MTPERLQTVERLFHSALACEGEQRIAFLNRECAGDETLRLEVERLLSYVQQSDSFMESPALEELAPGDALQVMQQVEQLSTLGLQNIISSRDFPRPFEIGQIIAGRFEITREIGEGGMGVVYEAFDRKRNLRIAIKSAKPGFQRLLSPELEGALTVRHPNVCRVNEIHTAHTGHGEVDFLTMELLEGKTLFAYLKERGKLREAQALSIARQLCAGLAEAHRSGIIHRDLKSANVILCHSTDGHLRTVITDFGLAGAAKQSDEMAGTPVYMAPELWRGEQTSKASDIYALGVILYEMVVDPGLQRPKNGAPWSPELHGLSGPWARTIRRCISATPAARPKTAEEVLASLEKLSYPNRLLIALVLLVLVAGVWFWHSRPSRILRERDTIVLADFANSTGDPIFDDTLRTALNISLQQSPFLNVLPDSKVAKTLKQMTLPVNSKLTPEVTRELCQRADSKAYVAGSIGNLGSEYVLELKAVDCASGDPLAQQQETAASKEKVLNTLGKAASKLRRQLGESLATVQKFDVPLVEATTPSLEALKAYSLAGKAAREGGPTAAVPLDQQAIELDPNFAMAYRAIGGYYTTLGELGRGREYLGKAFDLRNHASEVEKLDIAAAYYRNGTGELEKSAQILHEAIASYPIASHYNNLAVIYDRLGQYEKAKVEVQQALHLAGDRPEQWANLANYTMALQRFDEAQEIVHEAQSRKIESFQLRSVRYALAFLRSDTAALEEQQQWFASQPTYENYWLALESDTEAYFGRLGKARELSKRALDSALRADNKEGGAIWLANGALAQAAFGDTTGAGEAAAKTLKLAPDSPGAEAEAALALSMSGETNRAESLAQDLEKRFPVDTQMQSLWLSAIRAELALQKKKPVPALKALEAASAVEFGQIPFANNISCLYPTYVRGNAYLIAGEGSAAAAEFQKIIDHDGIVWNCWTGALAHLGVARANALQAKTLQAADADAARARASAAYKDFLTLWKNADPDIPVLKQAKAEYAKLQ